MSSDLSYIPSFALIGDAGTGKTTLLTHLNQAIRVRFSQGVNSKDTFLDLDGLNQRFWIHDCRPDLRATIVQDSKVCEGVFLVFSLDNRETFNNLGAWVDASRQIGSKIFIVIVGNKADLRKNREVSMDEARNFAYAKGCMYMETSAKYREDTLEVFKAGVRMAVHSNNLKVGESESSNS